MQEHFCLVDRVSEVTASSVFNNVCCDALKHVQLVSIAIYYTQMLKQQMKTMEAHRIYLTKDQHLLGTVDWLVKDLEA
jgi:hypothetical protein